MSRYKVWADVNGKVETLEWIIGEVIAEPHNAECFRELMAKRGAETQDRNAAAAVMLGRKLFAKPIDFFSQMWETEAEFEKMAARWNESQREERKKRKPVLYNPAQVRADNLRIIEIFGKSDRPYHLEQAREAEQVNQMPDEEIAQREADRFAFVMKQRNKVYTADDFRDINVKRDYALRMPPNNWEDVERCLAKYGTKAEFGSRKPPRSYTIGSIPNEVKLRPVPCTICLQPMEWIWYRADPQHWETKGGDRWGWTPICQRCKNWRQYVDEFKDCFFD